MDIDVIGAAISQSTIQKPVDIGAVAYVAERIDAHVVGIVDTHRHQPMTNNLGNDVRPLEPLAGLGVKEYRTWCPIDTMRPSEMIGTEQYGRANLGICKAVSAGRGVIGDLAMQRITSVITVSLAEPAGACRVHRDAAKTDHRTAFEMRYDCRSMMPDRMSFFPPIALLF